MSTPPPGPPPGSWSGPPPGSWTTPPPPGPAPLDQPQYDATIRQAVVRFWRKYAVLSGRASRSEYWWWFLVAVVVGWVLQLVGSIAFGSSFFLDDAATDVDLHRFWLSLIPSLVWSVVTLVPTIAITVRRLHDTNRSGWWYLATLPGLAALPLLVAVLASLDLEGLEAGDVSSVAVGPLVAGMLLLLVGSVGSIVVLVFCILGPDPLGARFDRRS